GGGHDLPALAVAALGHVLGHPRGLHRVWLGGGAEALDGGDRLALDRADGQHAGANRLAVEVNGAGAALGHAAAELGAGHAEHVAQHPEQRHLGWSVDLVIDAVDYESDHRWASGAGGMFVWAVSLGQGAPAASHCLNLAT